ncbi:MAG TPA: MFS transporter [Patescibacteria group bacterium]|nr:MFS transporter [Patescibacteria group bacterium]
MFDIFRKRDFRYLWTAQLVSTIGSSLTDLAAAILVFRITGSALNVGLVLIVTALPTLVFGLVAGVFVDRFDRKTILLVSDLLRGLLVVAIPTAVEMFGLPGLYGIIFLAASVRQFFDPAWESILPEIATEEELTKANSFLSISSFGSTAVGFAAAGLLSSLEPDKITLPFYIDAATFFVSFLCVLAVKLPKQPAAEPTTVGVVLTNLREGVRILWGIPVLRSLLIAGLPVFLSFGFWNVMLLPMAIRVLGGTEFEYGLQEGLTSIGFVVGALLMARYIDRLAEGAWMVLSMFGMGIFGVLYGLSPNIWVAILMVMMTGFLNAPSGISRRTILQRNTPRASRGRVFSAFFVSRDVVNLIGMAGAGLADLFDVRALIVMSSVVLIGAGFLHQVLPGIGRPAAEWRRSLNLLRTAPSAPKIGAGRQATMLDFDRLLDVLPELGALAINRRTSFLADTKVARAAAGEAIIKVGDPAGSAFFVMSGNAMAGVPEGDDYRSLSTMGPGDFFGEIGAITGGSRTANVVATDELEVMEVSSATLKSLLDVPELHALINSKMTERLERTAAAPDFVRLQRLDQGDLADLRRRRPKGHVGARA